jgi:hypothetical protein
MSADEAQFVAVHVADAGHHALVEQRLGQRPVRIGSQVGRGRARIPVFAEQIGSEMSDSIDVVGPLEHFQDSEVDARSVNVPGLQDDSDPVTGPARLVQGRDLPASFHLQMRMDAGLPDPDEQVLAAADDFVNDLPGQVDGGVARNPDVAAGQGLSGERFAQDGGSVPDGVAFRHLPFASN